VPSFPDFTNYFNVDGCWGGGGGCFCPVPLFSWSVFFPFFFCGGGGGGGGGGCILPSSHYVKFSLLPFCFLTILPS